MTELENKIFQCALTKIEELKPHISTFPKDYPLIEFPFFCDGCFDKIVFDTEKQKFTSIKYTKGKGDGISIGGMVQFSGYFDEVEHCEFDITDLVN